MCLLPILAVITLHHLSKINPRASSLCRIQENSQSPDQTNGSISSNSLLVNIFSMISLQGILTMSLPHGIFSLPHIHHFPCQLYTTFTFHHCHVESTTSPSSSLPLSHPSIPYFLLAVDLLSLTYQPTEVSEYGTMTSLYRNPKLSINHRYSS